MYTVQSVAGTKEETCISAGGVWGNILVAPETVEWLARKNAGGPVWFEADDCVKRQFLMAEGVKYRVFLNPRSEYLSLSNIDIKGQMTRVQESIEQ
jgi:hypothetical protein